MAIGEHNSIHIVIALGIIGLFGIITFALTAATLGAVNKQFDDLNRQVAILHKEIADACSKSTTIATTTTTPPTTPTATTAPVTTPVTTPTAASVTTPVPPTSGP